MSKTQIKGKMRPKYVGYNQHDAGSIFKCPNCGKEYGGWTFAQYDDEIICRCKVLLTLKEIKDE